MVDRPAKIQADRAGEGPRYGVVLWAMLFAFLTYFCMYAFRKPVAAARFEGVDVFGGIGLKTAIVIAQLVGYTGSKYLGAAICSSSSRRVRLAWLIGCILAAESTLVAFADLLDLNAFYYHADEEQFLPVSKWDEDADCEENVTFMLFTHRNV